MTTASTTTSDFQACIPQNGILLARAEKRQNGSIMRLTEKGLDTGWYEILKIAADCPRTDLEVGDRVQGEKFLKTFMDGQEYFVFEASTVRMLLKKGQGSSRMVPVAADAPPPPQATSAAQPG
jgi:hypothetical protein